LTNPLSHNEWRCAVSISGISSLTSNSSPTSVVRPDSSQQFKQLADALNRGNLSDAQQAYAALSQLQDNGQGLSANSNSPFAKALNQIGQALQNGDLGGAQQALQSFQQARGGHHHGHHGSSDVSPVLQTASSTSVATDNSTSTGVDITA
jgi:soluble cytochrome b562